MGKKIVMFALLCISAMLIGCGNKADENKKDVVEARPLVIKTIENVEDNLKEEQKVYVDIGFIDEEYLMKIAQYKGGSLENRIYTILTTLNKAQEKELTDTYSDYSMSMIQDTVLNELYNIDGLTPYDFEEIVPDETTKEAMQIVKCKKTEMKYKD